MNFSDAQRQIDQIDWYHEFDFGNGLRAQAKTPDAANHRAIWKNIEDQLAKIDFNGKTVLDIGCWDGFWSFYAEQRGAKHVLATDDISQNWAGNRGIQLAKSLLGSSIETKEDISIYDLQSLGRTFDIVLCLGVYYHLVDPFYAFTQVRHCCHPNTVVVFEGDGSMGLPANLINYDLRDPALPIFVPPPDGLADMLRACYFDVISQVPWPPVMAMTTKWKERLKFYYRIITRLTYALPTQMVRLTSVCRPIEADNPLHPYKPPFGLHQYDPRFRDNLANRP
jgi:tRNA (mo5U34)-methyltransferase